MVPAPASGGQGNPQIVGIGAGNAEIAYQSNPGTGNQVFVEAVNYQVLAAAAATPTPAADTVTTTQTAGAMTGASLKISAGTVGETDRATIAGAKASTATGTVTYNLYSASSCTASSEVFHGGTVSVTGGVAAPSASVTSALAPGSYYWQATYSGDANNLANVSACGSEVLTVVPAATIEGGGTSTSTTVTITITCASTPCTVTITITVTEKASKASVARKKHARTKTVTLASGKFTIQTKGPKKLTLHLTKAGRKLVARDHGHLRANVRVAETTPGGVQYITRTITIRAAKPKHKHKK